MALEQRFTLELEWLGDRGTGTSGHRDYGREHELRAGERPAIAASADRVFRGHDDRWNPELLLLGALAECHMMSYLHVAAGAGVRVVGYRDAPSADLVVEADGSGRMTGAVLRPEIELAEGSDLELAVSLHERAARLCFIANSVAFPVQHEPRHRLRG